MPTSAQTAATTRGHGSSIYVAFVPWILFSVVTERDPLKTGALVALVAAVAIALPSVLAGRPKLLELGAIAAFAGFSVAAFALDPAASDDLSRYARAIAVGLLALIAFGSLLWTPFTEQYARESVPRQFWSSPNFKYVNRCLTRMWAFVFVGMMVSHVVAGSIDTHRGNTIFNWVIPIALVVWAAKRTDRLAADAGGEAAQPEAILVSLPA